MIFTKLAPFLLALSVLTLPVFSQGLTGTLVVAVPVNEGLVVCADKRLFNHATGTFTDDAVKIRKAGDKALFVATNTIGFRDARTGAMTFDAFDVTEKYIARYPFVDTRQFWDGLREDVRKKLVDYFSTQRAADLPPTDFESGRLLFNLVFYSVAAGRARSHTLKVFYEKAATPIVYIPGVLSEEVRTPKLSGKGRVVMAHIARTPSLRTDASILRFDQGRFSIQRTTTSDAVAFADKLFSVTNTALPGAYVSATSDCALLSYRTGFQMRASQNRDSHGAASNPIRRRHDAEARTQSGHNS